jgi:NADH-quinone oxidoreductase subunit L
VMAWPAILLAIGALGAGAFLMLGSRLIDFLAPVIGRPPSSPGLFTPAGIGALALLVAAVILAWVMYGRREVPVTAPPGSPVTAAARKELYGNAINESVLMRPGQWLTRLSVYFDNRGVDGLVNTLAATMGGTSGRMRRAENGLVRTYALQMFVGAALLVLALLLVRI